MAESLKEFIQRLGKDLAVKGTYFVPEEVAIRRIVSKRWREQSKELAKLLVDQCAEESGEMHPDKIRGIFVSVAKQKMRSLLADMSNPVQYFLRRAYRKAIRYALKNLSKKVDSIDELGRVLFDSEAEREAVQVMLKQFDYYVDSSIERFLIDHLLEFAKQTVDNPLMRIVDKLELVKKLQNIINYDAGIAVNANVVAGRSFAFGMIDYFEEYGIVKYTIIGILDTKICVTCLRVVGKVFTVENVIPLKKKILATQPEDIKEIAPFPKETDFDNLSPEQVQALPVITPLHCRCRCVMAGV
jgi:uncharacterized protein YnzC (UPF0291/DUF896 family)